MIIERGLFISFASIFTVIWTEIAMPGMGRALGLFLIPIIVVTMLMAPNVRQPSFGFTYLVVFILFHMGLTYTASTGLISSPKIITFIEYWFPEELAREAEFLCIVGAVAFSSGYFCIRSKSKTNIRATKSFFNSEIGGITGMLILVLALVAWLYLMVSNNALGTYENYNNARLNPIFSAVMGYVYMAIGLGVCIAALSTDGMRRGAVILFVIWSAVAFPLGLRGEVLFPAAALLATYAAKYRINWGLLVVGVVALAVAISVVRGTRNTGDAGEDFTANPLDAIAELGGSIRPVYEVLKWREEGDDFIWGSSYWAPVERMFLRIFPVKARPAAEDDDRLMNILIVKRAGSYGFSPVAEGYRNFGIPGVVVFMFIVGLIVRVIDLRGINWRYSAYGILIYLVLMMNIRNAFTPVIATAITWSVPLMLFELMFKKYQNQKAV